MSFFIYFLFFKNQLIFVTSRCDLA